MRFRKALVLSLKYHSLAFVPTLLGLGIAAAGLWFGVGRPLMGILDGGLAASLDVVRQAVQVVNAPVAIAGVLGGWFVRRVGRTATLFWTHGRNVSAKLDQVVEASADSNDGIGAGADGQRAPESTDQLSAESGGHADAGGIAEPDPAVTKEDVGDRSSISADASSSAAGGRNRSASSAAQTADDGDEYDPLGFADDEGR